MSVLEDMYSTVWFMQLNMIVFAGGNISPSFIFRETGGEMWMYKCGTYYKSPSGVHWWALKDHLSMQYNDKILFFSLVLITFYI